MAAKRKPGNVKKAAKSQKLPVFILKDYYESLEKNPALRAAINTRAALWIEELKYTHTQAWGHFESSSKAK